MLWLAGRLRPSAFNEEELYRACFLFAAVRRYNRFNIRPQSVLPLSATVQHLCWTTRSVNEWSDDRQCCSVKNAQSRISWLANERHDRDGRNYRLQFVGRRCGVNVLERLNESKIVKFGDSFADTSDSWFGRFGFRVVVLLLWERRRCCCCWEDMSMCCVVVDVRKLICCS